MKLTRLRCPNCGADFENIDVTEDQKVFKCTRLGCGASFILDQGIRFADIKQAEAEKIRHYREELKRSLSPFDRHLAGRYAGNILAILPDDYRAKAILAIAQSGEQNSRPLYYFLQSEPACTPEEFEEVFPYLLERCDYRGLNLLRDAVAAVEPEDRQQQFLEKIDRQVAYIKRKVEDYADIPRDIFVCHSSDDLGIVMKMVDVLEADGNKCWYSERNMPPDSLHYWEKIKEAIRRCTIFLVCCSGSAMLSDPVQTEIRLAEEAGVKRLELKLDDTPHTSLFKHFFNGISWVKLDDDFDGAMEQLKEFVYRLKYAEGGSEEKAAQKKAEEERLLAEQRRRHEKYEALLREREEEKQRMEELRLHEGARQKQEEQRKREEAEQLRRAEEERKLQEEAERKRLEAERLQEEQRKAEEERQRQKEQKRLEEEKKKAAELDRQRKTEEERKQQEEQKLLEEQERWRQAVLREKQASEKRARIEAETAEQQELKAIKKRLWLVCFVVGIYSYLFIVKPMMTEISSIFDNSSNTDLQTVTIIPQITIVPTPTALPLTSFSKLNVMDEFTFGKYEQDNDLTNGSEPIEWRILKIEEGKALVISINGLETMQFNETTTDVTWETCSLREWLNGTFYNSAFSSTEKTKIWEKINNNWGNSNYKTEDGDPTIDNIFLLSIYEIKGYYGWLSSLPKCEPTVHAKRNEVFVGGNAYSRWWLRTPGCRGDLASYADLFGRGEPIGDDVSSFGLVRPAFWLKLSE